VLPNNRKPITPHKGGRTVSITFRLNPGEAERFREAVGALPIPDWIMAQVRRCEEEAARNDDAWVERSLKFDL